MRQLDMDDETVIQRLKRQLLAAETAIGERDDLQRTTLTDEFRIMTRMHELADRLLAISDLSIGLDEVLDAA